jgi:GTP-binding protein
MIKMPTPRLTRILLEATTQHQPPKSGPFRPKLRYAHQGGSNPPLVIIHGTSLASLSASYKRYLESTFRKAFELTGTPLRVQFKQGHNPFADRAPPPKTEADEKRAHRQRRRGRKLYG